MIFAPAKVNLHQHFRCNWRKMVFAINNSLFPLVHKNCTFCITIIQKMQWVYTKWRKYVRLCMTLRKKSSFVYVRIMKTIPTIITTSFWKQQISKSMFIGALRVIHYTMCCVRVLLMLFLLSILKTVFTTDSFSKHFLILVWSSDYFDSIRYVLCIYMWSTISILSYIFLVAW